jgi:predicted nucleic acid-binding protein
VKQRIVFDSGILIAAAIIPDGLAAGWIDKGISYYNADFEIYISTATIERARRDSKDMPHVDNDRIDEFFNELPRRVSIVSGSTSSNAEETLSAADLCKPHMIIAGDSNLTTLKQYKRIGIYHPSHFKDFLTN